MSRVLLVCPEPLDHQQPAGIGVRFLEIERVLRGDGHDVTLISAPIAPQMIVTETARADVAVVQGHAANDLFAHGRSIPTVVDLYDPFIIENLHYYPARGAEVFTHDHATLIRSLVRGDYFLCASEAQRLFYIGVLLATGRVNPAVFERDPTLASLIAIAPFGVQPPRTRASRTGGSAILFGGIYDWYDPLLAIDAAAIARRTIPDLTLTFTRHPNPELTPQGKAAEAAEYAHNKGFKDFIRFEPWVPYARRGEFFDRYDLALLTFQPSLETDLSMRTRIYDYLWGGLPVVTSSAAGTDEILRKYGCGSVIDHSDPAHFAGEIVAILRDHQKREEMRRGSVRFAAEHQWRTALEPLRAFCAAPRVEPTKEAFALQLDVPQRSSSILTRLKRRIGGAF